MTSPHTAAANNGKPYFLDSTKFRSTATRQTVSPKLHPPQKTFGHGQRHSGEEIEHNLSVDRIKVSKHKISANATRNKMMIGVFHSFAKPEELACHIQMRNKDLSPLSFTPSDIGAPKTADTYSKRQENWCYRFCISRSDLKMNTKTPKFRACVYVALKIASTLLRKLNWKSKWEHLR